ncbi:MAG TPA: glycosyltransferase family 1 protein, partial [Chloroflexota bacterium]
AGALAAAMERILLDPDLTAVLRQRGRERAATFTWRRAAAQTIAVYRQVLARGASAEQQSV